MLERTAACAIVVLAGLAGPGTAQAVTTQVEGSGPNVRVRVTNEGQLAKNNIAVSENAAQNLVVTDVGADVDAVVAQGTCSQASPTTVVCPPDPGGTRRLDVTPGEGDDAVSIGLPRRSLAGVATIFVNGGNGADSLIGSAGPDTLEGDGLTGIGGSVAAAQTAPGKDVIIGLGDRDTLRGGDRTDYLNGGGATGPDEANTLDGGPGSDYFELGPSLGPDRVIGGGDERGQFNSITVNRVQHITTAGDTASYEARTFSAAGTTGVTADIDSSADDGATGAAEGDQIDPDVEALVGSVRDDRLVGASGVNRLQGGLGVDSLVSGGGGDTLHFRDGVRDRCYSVSGGVTVDLDLTDPTLADCQISILPLSTKLTRSPIDETMRPPVIGKTVRRRRGKLTATIRCARGAPKACSGSLTAQRARGGRRLARRRYRIRPGAVSQGRPEGTQGHGAQTPAGAPDDRRPRRFATGRHNGHRAASRAVSAGESGDRPGHGHRTASLRLGDAYGSFVASASASASHSLGESICAASTFTFTSQTFAATVIGNCTTTSEMFTLTSPFCCSGGSSWPMLTASDSASTSHSGGESSWRPRTMTLTSQMLAATLMGTWIQTPDTLTLARPSWSGA